MRKNIKLSVLGVIAVMFLTASSGQVKPEAKPATAQENKPQSAVAKTDLALTLGSLQKLYETSSNIIKVTIGTSRSKVTAEQSYGIYADIENVGSSPVDIYDRHTVLVVQPEVTQNGTCVFRIEGFFPTEYDSTQPMFCGGQKSDDHRGCHIHIKPKEQYRVFWDVGSHNTYAGCDNPDPNNPTSMSKKPWWAPFTFEPGDYVFTVEGKAYVVGPDGKEEDTYHTFVQGTRLQVGISQLTAIMAAIFGGLLAFLIDAFRRPVHFTTLTKSIDSARPWAITKALAVILTKMFYAILTSAAVTILSSRIADTQLPVKVSVSDFWGALTIGFCAYFVGNKLIDRLVGVEPGPDKEKKNEQAAVAANLPPQA